MVLARHRLGATLPILLGRAGTVDKRNGTSSWTRSLENI